MASFLNPFQLTPKEILDHIVSYLDSKDSLLRLSSTCQYLRLTPTPRAFSQVTVPFSATGFDRLAGLSKSDCRQHVVVLTLQCRRNRRPTFVCHVSKPEGSQSKQYIAIQNWEAFEASIYRPSEYVSDQAQSLWRVSQADMRYDQFWTTLTDLCSEQQLVLDQSRDTSVLSAALSSMKNLKIFTLRFMSLTDTLPPAFEYIADRITRPVDFSTKTHLVAASQAFHVLQTHERRGRALEIQGGWSSGGTSTSTNELRIASNQSALDYICQLQLPGLPSLLLTSLRLPLQAFSECVPAKAPRLSTLSLDDVILSLDEPTDNYSYSPHDVPSARLQQAVQNIGQSARLEHVTIRGFPRHQITDRSCFEDLFCWRVDSSHITASLIESLTPG